MQTKVKLSKRVVSLATALVTGLSAVGVTGIPGGYLERYLQVQRMVTITSTVFAIICIVQQIGIPLFVRLVLFGRFSFL